MSRWARGVLAASTILSAAHFAASLPEKATIVEATASAYDSRSVSDSGCYEDGCVPDLVKDGDVDEESRWSCQQEGTTTDSCYITLELTTSYTLSELHVYFRDSSTRTRSIIVSSSVSGTSFTYLFEDESTLGTADDASDTFSFPTGSTGQYVRLTGTGLDDEDWLSILEVEVYVEVEETPAPVITVVPTPGPAKATPAPVTATAPPTMITAAPVMPSPAPARTLSPVAIGTPAPVTITITSAPAGSTPQPGMSTPAPTAGSRGNAGVATVAPASQIAPTAGVAPTSAPLVAGREISGGDDTGNNGSGDNDTVIIAGGAAGGVVLLVAIAALVFCTMKSRRSHRPPPSYDDMTATA